MRASRPKDPMVLQDEDEKENIHVDAVNAGPVPPKYQLKFDESRGSTASPPAGPLVVPKPLREDQKRSQAFM